MALSPGDKFGLYEVLALIGAGGMGEVYKARDTRLGRSVALKLVRGGAQVDERARSRLLREARTASSLSHPNICVVFEAGMEDDETYIAMELVEGQPLSTLIATDPLPIEEVIRYGSQIADALAHAHDRGVIHRDLKSANVIVTPERRAKVLDFGLAKRVIEGPDEPTRTLDSLNEAGAVAGTISYMAPEVLRGAAADARGDLWALGVVLYEAITGTQPFSGATKFEVISSILRDSVRPLPPNVPPALVAVIQRLLAKQPADRYQRAVEVRDALEEIQPSVNTSALILVPSRRRWFWAAVALAPVTGAAWFGLLRHYNSATSSGLRLSDGGRPSSLPEANEYYERGLLFSGAQMDLVQWRRMMEHALALDPRFAAARGQLAFTLMMPSYFGQLTDVSQLYTAEKQARQALRDDPDCAAAHSALAGSYLSIGRTELAITEAEQALRTNPYDPAIQLWVPQSDIANGDYEKAIRKMKQLIAQFPLFLPGRIYYADAIREQGDTAGAIQQLQTVLEQAPAVPGPRWKLARAYMDAGDLGKARRVMEAVNVQVRQIPWSRLTWALLLALEGNQKEARAELDESALAWAASSYLGPLLPAEVYAVLGDSEKAFEWLDRAARWGDEREDWLRRDPHLASIRNQSRFQAVLDSVSYRRKQRSGPRIPNQ